MQKKNYPIEYYYENGEYPIIEFIEKLTPDQIGALKKYSDLLEERGPALHRPHVEKAHGYERLWELRPSFWKTEIRILFTWKNNRPVYLEGFIEKAEGKKTERHYKRADGYRKNLDKI
jgi:hypothetical protein